MNESRIGMAFHCPLKASALKNTSDGKFCCQCSKHIPNMRKSSTEEIIREIKGSNGDFCGTFNSLQLHNPFGDKRDKIVSWYQRFSNKPKMQILVLLAFITVVLTGCRTRFLGYPGVSYSGMPILRVHPRSIMEFSDSPDIIKHNVYKIHLKEKKEKKIKTNKYKRK